MTGDRRTPWDSTNAAAARYTMALRDASGRVPDHDVDWEAFYTRLCVRAELELARLRYPQVASLSSTRAQQARQADSAPLAWWEHAARWGRTIVAASVAAGIALIMVVRASPKETPDAVVATAIASATDAPRAAFESVVVGHGPTSALRAALLPTAADLLIPLGRAGPGQ